MFSIDFFIQFLLFTFNCDLVPYGLCCLAVGCYCFVHVNHYFLNSFTIYCLTEVPEQYIYSSEATAYLHFLNLGSLWCCGFLVYDLMKYELPVICYLYIGFDAGSCRMSRDGALHYCFGFYFCQKGIIQSMDERKGLVTMVF